MRFSLLALLCAACAPEPTDPAGAVEAVDGSAFRSLAQGFRPSFTDGTEDGAAIRRGPRRGVAEVATALSSAGWTSHGKGLWSAPRFAPAVAQATGESGRPTLRVDGEELPLLPKGPGHRLERMERLGRPAALPPATPRPGFHLTAERCYALLEPGAPPGEALLTERLVLGESHAQRWRLTVDQHTFDGFGLLAGSEERVTVDAPPNAALRLSAAAHGGTLRLIVRLGELVLHEVELTGAAPLTVPLPSAGGPLELVFEAQGPRGLVALADPVVGPRVIGSYEDRPWASPPDIVLLLADTYRADLLEAWGGDPRLTPRLNELAAVSRVYRNARTPATWTLPAHAAMFSARPPASIGVRSPRDALAPELVTLAEQLRDGGYRTAAVTDGAFVSTTFGMDQGFTSFQELPSPGVDLALTVAKVSAALAADDGRPLFLFVQSYRAHERGTFSPEVRERLAGFPLPGKVDILQGDRFKRLQALVAGTPRGTPLAGPDFEELVRPKGQHYLGACAEADRGFGLVLEQLAAAGLGQQRVLVFTSDHGEAFGEQGVIGHGTGVFGTQARVPLLLAAPGVEPGLDARPASLLDLPRTLCGFAGIPAHPDWHGADLTAPVPAGRPLVISQLYPDRVEDAAVVRDGWKVVFEADDGLGALRLVYDLRRDPNEESPLDEGALPFPVDELRALIEAAHREVLLGEEAELPAERMEQLNAMGYGGDDEPR